MCNSAYCSCSYRNIFRSGRRMITPSIRHPFGLRIPQSQVAPQSEVGPQGLQGEVGPQGPQGEVGPQGEIGSRGHHGMCFTNSHYNWFFKTDSQTVSEGSFSNIIFNTSGLSNGWTYDQTIGEFTCNHYGTYLISYRVYFSSSNDSTRVCVKAAIDNNEIMGSAVTQNIQSPFSQNSSNSFIVLINNDSKFTLQAVCNQNNTVFINHAESILNETPISASITFTRIG